MSVTSPEIGQRIQAAGIETNLPDQGEGHPVMFIHGSGPGVTACANGRLVLPELAKACRGIAPDMLGLGVTERPVGVVYGLDAWVRHAVGVLDALNIAQTDLVGQSFGGAIALALAIRHPERVRRLVLMCSVGVPFAITPGLDAVCGYHSSLSSMRGLLDIFASDRSLVTDELSELR